MRLINAESPQNRIYVSDLVIEEMKKIPTVDIDRPTLSQFKRMAVQLRYEPVIHCRECKHYQNHPNGLCYAHTEPGDNERGYKGETVCVEPEDFCSYGERMTQNERRAETCVLQLRQLHPISNKGRNQVSVCNRRSSHRLFAVL